jgi:hypothetical protein
MVINQAASPVQTGIRDREGTAVILGVMYEFSNFLRASGRPPKKPEENQKDAMPRCWLTARTLKTSLIWRRCLTSDSASFSLFSSSPFAISRFRT